MNEVNRYLAKLASPLCVNFLMLIHFEKSGKATQFDSVAGKIASWNFVGMYLTYCPCMICVLCIMIQLNLYSKFMKCIGFDDCAYYNFYEAEKARLGKDILHSPGTKLGLQERESKTIQPNKIVVLLKENY